MRTRERLDPAERQEWFREEELPFLLDQPGMGLVCANPDGCPTELSPAEVTSVDDIVGWSRGAYGGYRATVTFTCDTCGFETVERFEQDNV